MDDACCRRGRTGRRRGKPGQPRIVVPQPQRRPQRVRKKHVAHAAVRHDSLVHAADNEGRGRIPRKFQPALQGNTVAFAVRLKPFFLKPLEEHAQRLTVVELQTGLNVRVHLA